MLDPMIARVQDWLRAHEGELLEDTIAMLRIPSIEGDPQPNAPYGKENRAALNLALSLAGKFGMSTTDLEGYIGYGEFGKGERLVVSLGHLDVVPVGPGWKHDPFGAEVEDGYLYSRGSTDDKGPTMASLYAMRAIKECCPDIPARMRQVFGCNEESGFGCVARYMQTEEPPTYGVAPDSGWPLYHCEKGIANLEITVPLSHGDMELLSVEGGQRPNIVIDSCTARVRVQASARRHVEEKLADSWDRNVTFAWDGDELAIFAVGKACHGSQPFLGDSAAIRIFRFLNDITPLSTAKYYGEMLELTHIGGAGLGIAGADAVSKDLTCNLGIVKTEGSELSFLFNIRYPATWKGRELEQMCRAHLESLKSGFALRVASDSPSLYFPLDHPLVKTIVDIYTEESGEVKQPGVTGGGTYARAIPNTVSIGTCWDGDGKAHENDERYKIENLFRASRIYAHILYRLATMAS